MKREELIELNVPEQAINKIMNINGADIEKVKAALKEKEKALTEAHKSLEAANKQIEEFKGIDIERIRKACDDWKQKAEQAEADKQKVIYESKVAGYVKGLKLKDEIYENHVTNMLLDKGLQFEGDKLIGADDVVNPFKESHPDAFRATKPAPTNNRHIKSKGKKGRQKRSVNRRSSTERIW